MARLTLHGILIAFVVVVGYVLFAAFDVDLVAETRSLF